MRKIIGLDGIIRKKEIKKLKLYSTYLKWRNCQNKIVKEVSRVNESCARKMFFRFLLTTTVTTRMLTFSTVSALSRGALSDWDSHKTGFSGYITIPFLGLHLPTLNVKKYTEYNNGYVYQLNSNF